ncbi:MAG: threonine--tRNA ligase [bacterium]
MSGSKTNNNIENIRHSLAHLLAMAVRAYDPEVKFGIGPVIDNGFYYDFEFSPEKTPSPEALKQLQKEIKKYIAQNLSFEQKFISEKDARQLFSEQLYKLELIDELVKVGEKISVYTCGDFTDLCSGPHIASTKEIKNDAFALVRLAGAYWRGSEENAMLTRIYGYAFKTKEELDAFLTLQEEAKKRDHRKLGKELDLFTFSELVGGGLPLWTPKGTILREELDSFVWELRKAKGYQKVSIPHITKKDLYETSGHWSKFAEELFRIKTREGHEFAMKPMNCPHHTQIFAHLPRSYKDMPQRYAETTMVYRDEQSGELSGLSRVRCITQDDAHVFCRENQIKGEIFLIWDIIDTFYSTFGFELKVRLSLHDPNNFDAYLGTKEIWKNSENMLRELAKERGAEYFEAQGEAAMYGPKVDFITKDSLGREWQVATIQLDRNMPERFDLFCINEKGEKERAIMIHAAIMGSIERFSSVLIEHLAGNFPTWLSPVQVAVLAVGADQNSYAEKIHTTLKEKDIRVEFPETNETLGYRIREAEKQKIPYILVVGKKEEEQQTVSIRKRGQKDGGVLSIDEFITNIAEEIRTRKA